jgi:nucleotide-binding universal stress UspA family protein
MATRSDKTKLKAKSERIAVVGSTPDEIAGLLPFADVLAQARDTTQVVVGLVSVPPEESLSTGARTAQALRRKLEPLRQQPETRIVVRVAHDIWSEMRRVVAHEKCDLALIRWSNTLPTDALRDLPFDSVIVNGTFPKQLQKILLPIRGGPHAALALEIALAFAETCPAEITLLRAIPPALFRKEQVRELFNHLQALPQITHWLRVQGDPAQAIVEHATPDAHQLVVMGSIARPQRGDPPIGATAQRVLNEIEIPTLVVKTRHTQPESATIDSAAPVDYTISVIVDKWFAENTFHAREFQDIARLVQLKERQGLTISLGLPTLNEEETIGKVVQTMRKSFVKEYPLLDELVVIDSNSTDRTVEIAQDLGVRVVRHPDVLTQYGVATGKGEALWNSLYILQGDLIAWIDTDIANIHPRFVHGILGPLIREPHLMYVKGFYQRPLRIGRVRDARGGGRVTELVARPLLNLFYPELSGFVQPLAGEYAGRRAALESVPFYIGYGVETGLLIDLLLEYGLNAMGQVDLEERVHRNQSLMALSKMAFEIVQVVMARVGEKSGVELVDEINKSMKLIRHEADAFQLDIAEVRARARPPMITIPEYRALRGLPPLQSDAPSS